MRKVIGAAVVVFLLLACLWLGSRAPLSVDQSAAVVSQPDSPATAALVDPVAAPLPVSAPATEVAATPLAPMPPTTPYLSNASVLSKKDYPRCHPNMFRRASVVEATFKYPLVRSEETIVVDEQTGAETVQSRRTAVADHVLVRLAKDAGEAALKELVAKSGHSIRQKLRAPGMYLVALNSKDVDALPNALTLYNEAKKTVAYAEADFVNSNKSGNLAGNKLEDCRVVGSGTLSTAIDGIVYANEMGIPQPADSWNFGATPQALTEALACATPLVASRDVGGYSTDFNAPPAGWTYDAPIAGVGWAVDATPSTFPSGVSKTGSSLNYNNGVDYGGGANQGGAMSPSISLTGLTNPVLKFWSNYQTETRTPDRDRRIVQIYDTTGTTKLAEWQLATVGYSFNPTGGLLGIGPGPSGDSYIDIETGTPVASWHRHKIYLDPAWGSIRVRFVFDTVDNLRNGYAGWAIDDLAVESNTTAAPTGWPDMFPDLTTSSGFNSTSRSSNQIAWAWSSINQGSPNVHMIIGNNPQAQLDDSFLFYHTSHAHYHMSQYADFSLWQEQPGVGLVKIRRSPKRSYCLTDVSSYVSGFPSISPGCGGAWQAISYNWKDIYGSGTAGQSIDVTGLTTGGQFYLVGITDPLNRIRELNNMNNVDYIRFNLPASGGVQNLARSIPYPPTTTALTITSATVGTYNSVPAINITGTGFDTTLVPVVFDVGTAVAESPFYTIVSGTEIWVNIPAGITTPATVDLLRARGDAASFRIINGPYVAYKNHTVDDDSTGGTTGNNNGVINPGETVGFNVTLSNYGTAAASGVNATLALAAPNASVTIVQSSVAYGAIAAGAQSAGSGQFRVQINPAAVTPMTLSFVLTITDDAARTWVRNVSDMVYTSGTISGKVVKVTGATPISGASVVYTGPTSGTATTAADGTYSINTINGAYTLTAKAATYVDSSPRNVTTPPSAANIDFSLGAPVLNVTPSITLNAEEGASTSAPLSVSNTGDVNLTFGTATGAAYTATWLSKTPSSGTVAPAGSQNITVTGNAATIDAGTYTSKVGVTSNDPARALIDVPVTFNVAAAPRIVYVSNAINDDSTAPSIGDGDAAVEPGETFELNVSIRNSGHAAGANLSGLLSTADTNATVLTNSANFPAAASLATVSSSTPFVVRIATACPNNRAIAYALRVTDGTRVWNLSFTVTVNWRLKMSGVVTAVGSGAPISGATVSVAGKTATTNASGAYTITAIAAGTYTATASKTGYIAASSSAVFPPDLVKDFQLGFPNAVVTPAAVSTTVAQGGTGSRTLNIANTGNLPLTWTLNTGLGGFTVSNSTQTGGPVYNWQEISVEGVPITGFSDDTNLGPFDIGFNFPFYGSSFNQCRICSNGWLSFTDSSSTTYSNTTLPTTGAPANMIAMFWDDLYFDTNPKSYFKRVDANTFIIEFNNVQFYSDRSRTATFQVILKSDGSIILQYKSIGTTTSCTIGVQNADRTKGVTVVANGAYLSDLMAIKLTPTPNWLTVNPLSGTTAAAANSNVTLNFDATAMASGTYATNVGVQSNDPETPNINVPVTMVVNAAPVIDSLPSAAPNPVRLPATTTLTVAASDDGLPNPPGALTYTWSLVAGPGTVGFSPNGSTTSNTSTATFSAPGVYTLRVSVDDGHQATTADLDVTVLPATSVTVAALDANAKENSSDTGTFRLTRTGDTTAALTVTYAMSGTATNGTDYVALSGSVAFAAGATTANVVVTQKNDALIEGIETVVLTVTPGVQYDVGAPASATVNLFDDEQSVITVGLSDIWASEPGTDTGRFIIYRSAPYTGALTVNYAMSGTATNGVDYVSLPGTVTIPASTSYVYVYVTPLNDTLLENIESVTLTVSPAATYQVGTPNSGSLNLLDDEMYTVWPTVSDSAAREPGTDKGSFRINRSGGNLTVPLTVNYTMSGTALNGTDYAALSGTATIAANTTYVTITVSPIDDTLLENIESVILTIPANAAYQRNGTTTASFNILDDEMPIISVAATDGTALEAGADGGLFTITRGGNLASAVTVNWALSATATNGVDFTAIPMTTTIPAGATSATVAITPINDALVEGREYVSLYLSANASYQLGAPNAATVYLYDDEKPEVRIAVTDSSATEAPGNTGTFTISRVGAGSSALTVNYTIAGTATNGTDYAALSGTATIAAGATTTTVVVAPIEDTTAEGSESVSLTITANAAYTVGTGSAAISILDND